MFCFIWNLRDNTNKRQYSPLFPHDSLDRFVRAFDFAGILDRRPSLCRHHFSCRTEHLTSTGNRSNWFHWLTACTCWLDRLTNWLNDWLTDWLTGWANWLTSLASWLTNWLAYWLTDWWRGIIVVIVRSCDITSGSVSNFWRDKFNMIVLTFARILACVRI